MTARLVETIALRLKAARKAAGFKSAKIFAASQHIPLSTYSQHETGKRSISAELIISYSDQLNVHPYWLLTGNGDPNLHFVSPETRGQFYKVNLDLLKKILLAIEPLLDDQSIALSYPALINYCFDIYAIVSTLSADATEIEKIISLTISSLKRGAAMEAKSQSKDRLTKLESHL